MNAVNKKTPLICEDAYMKIETDKELASLDGPSEKSTPDFSETAPRPLWLGDSALKQPLPCLQGYKSRKKRLSTVQYDYRIPPSPDGANSAGF